MTARPMGVDSVLLRGGPADGCKVDVNWGTTLSVGGMGLPDGKRARYRPSREHGVYTFRGLESVVATLPMPGDQS